MRIEISSFLNTSLALHFTLESDLERAEELIKALLLEETSSFRAEAQEYFESLKKRYDIKQRSTEPEVQLAISSATAVKMTVWYMAPQQKATQIKNRIINLLIKRIEAEPTIHFSKKSKSEAGEESSE